MPTRCTDPQGPPHLHRQGGRRCACGAAVPQGLGAGRQSDFAGPAGSRHNEHRVGQRFQARLRLDRPAHLRRPRPPALQARRLPGAGVELHRPAMAEAPRSTVAPLVPRLTRIDLPPRGLLRSGPRRRSRPLPFRPSSHVRPPSSLAALLLRDSCRSGPSLPCSKPPSWMRVSQRPFSKQQPTSWTPASSSQRTARPALELDRSRISSGPPRRRSTPAACPFRSKSCQSPGPGTSARPLPWRPSSSLAWHDPPAPCEPPSWPASSIRCLARSGHAFQ